MTLALPGTPLGAPGRPNSAEGRVPMAQPQLPLAESEEHQSSMRSNTSSVYFPPWIMASWKVLLFGRDSGVKISVDAFVLLVK